ncbi:MAG: HNH endonuclease signature motif containing protein [Kiritimatiellae bacterium]|nr:HNH endonuclease signature motif containing protein [Kiritimatiellia bacterium]
MPQKPKRPCSYPGCPELTDGRFCVAHTKKESQRYERYDRDPEKNKRYGSSWRKIRAAFIKANPLCVRCQQEGRLTPAREVHHIIPLRDGGTNDINNLMALCRSCHSEITAREGGRWGDRGL